MRVLINYILNKIAIRSPIFKQAVKVASSTFEVLGSTCEQMSVLLNTLAEKENEIKELKTANDNLTLANASLNNSLKIEMTRNITRFPERGTIKNEQNPS